MNNFTFSKTNCIRDASKCQSNKFQYKTTDLCNVMEKFLLDPLYKHKNILHILYYYRSQCVRYDKRHNTNKTQVLSKIIIDFYIFLSTGNKTEPCFLI